MADHIAERIPEEIRKEIAKNPTGDLTKSIESVFLKVNIFKFLNSVLQIDNELRLIDSDQTGSTACVVLIR